MDGVLNSDGQLGLNKGAIVNEPQIIKINENHKIVKYNLIATVLN